MQNFYKRGGYTSNRKNKKGITIYLIYISLAVFIGVTLAFFANSDFATSLLGVSGRVKITAVGRGNIYQLIEDKDGISNMEIHLQDGYKILIPGMEIDAQANVKVHRSTTKPLLRAKLTVRIYDKDGKDLIFVIHLKNADVGGELRIPEGTERLSQGCFQWEQVNTLYIPSSVNYIDNGAFMSNPQFKEIIVDSGNTKFKSIDSNSLLLSIDSKYAYRYATLNPRTHYDIPEGIIYLNNAFAYLNYVKSITIPSSVVSLGAEPNSQKLESIEVASGNTEYYSVDNVAVIIKKTNLLYMLAGGYKGGSYTVPQGATRINSYLTNLLGNDCDFVLPTSVASIGSGAFTCIHVRSLEFESSIPPTFESDLFTSINRIHANFKIYVPDDAVDVYKEVHQLRMVRDRIYPISAK